MSFYRSQKFQRRSLIPATSGEQLTLSAARISALHSSTEELEDCAIRLHEAACEAGDAASEFPTKWDTFGPQVYQNLEDAIDRALRAAYGVQHQIDVATAEFNQQK